MHLYVHCTYQGSCRLGSPRRSRAGGCARRAWRTSRRPSCTCGGQSWGGKTGRRSLSGCHTSPAAEKNDWVNFLPLFTTYSEKGDASSGVSSNLDCDVLTSLHIESFYSIPGTRPCHLIMIRYKTKLVKYNNLKFGLWTRTYRTPHWYPRAFGNFQS